MKNRKRGISVLLAAAMLLQAMPAGAAAYADAAPEPVTGFAAVREELGTAEITTDSTEAATNTTETTTNTTETTATAAQAVHPLLYAVCDANYPQGDTLLHLYLTGNTGLEAIGLSLTLPDCLTPEYQANGEAVFYPTEALSDAAFACYAPATHKLSLAYAAKKAGAAAEELGCFRLHIGADARVGQVYAILLEADADSFSAVGTDTLDCKTLCAFAPVAPMQRTLSETAVTLSEQDGAYALSLSPEPPEGACTWQSSDPEIVSVDENGVLTAHANGKATVTVTCETLQYTCEVTAEIAREISQTELRVNTLGGKVQLTLVPEPMHAPVWSSEDESIVRMTADGTASVEACGTVWLTALCEGTEYRFEVKAIIERALNVTQYTFHDKSEMIRLSLSPASNNRTSWFTSNPEVAKVDAYGIVTPVANGTAIIQALCEGYEFSCVITVDLKMTLNLTAYAAGEIGDTVQLTLTPPPAEPETVIWKSSDEAVASVDENGLVTVLAFGEAIITADYRGTVYSCTVMLQEYLRGDVNGDGEIDAKDSMKALRAWADVALMFEPMPLTALQFRAADVDGNGELTLGDTMAILRYFAMELSGLEPDWDYAINPKQQKEEAE